jgi:aerobic-type carbon monoxide dehydrogenase small subunit (CoxS/CutS family)
MLSVTINGRAYGPREVRDELSMNDFLREYLGMTGTKFGCGAAQCLSCAVIVDAPDGTSYTTPTCIAPAASFNGKSIRTVEGHAKNGELSVLQKAFIEHFAFQCGYCTAGFLNEGQAPREVRDELSMNDFLREYLGMTGTKFGCGAAQCLSCARPLIVTDSIVT